MHHHENGMIYRELGRTGERISIIGIGGSHVGKPERESDSVSIIRRALDSGINFLDNSWDYNDGESERRMGAALQDGYRQRAFLMTKIDGRTPETVTRQIDESLARLRVDFVDLMQFHEVIRLEDPDRIFNSGAMEAMLAAQRAGKLRYIGFTGHKDPLVHLRMLEVAEAHGFHFDAVQMPVNVMDAHFRSFTENVLPALVRKGIGVLAMKPMGSGVIPESGLVSAVECLHYAMSQQVSTVITGIEKMERLDQALEAVRTFRPLTQAETYELLKRTAEAAAGGKYEPFKTTSEFDATAQNPSWLG